MIRFGKRCAAILKALPQTGPLFPNLRKVKSKDRANEFRQRCQGLGIKGVTLHSYRCSRAERAPKAKYPRREAEEALGHNCRAVHIAYPNTVGIWQKLHQPMLRSGPGILSCGMTFLATGRATVGGMNLLLIFQTK